MKKIIFASVCFFVFAAVCPARGKSDKLEELSENTEPGELPVSSENEGFEIPPEEKGKHQEPITPLYTFKSPEGNPVRLQESWGYVMQSRSNEYNRSIPLTDVCFFAAEINCYGELVGVPKRSSLDIGKARSHLVIVCESKSLTHFVLSQKYDVRMKIIKQIVKAAYAYDGVQIDFELVPAREKKAFLSFLADLRYMLGKEKWFSVCVPARFKLLQEDVYPYAQIATYCDRIFVMAYDEHWSNGVPGPVASAEFCKKIVKYAKQAIPEKKLIIGLPFYGRTWANETTEGAWYYSGANRIMTEHKVTEVKYEDGIPAFKYTTEVEVTGYINDAYSVVHLARIYENAGIKKMGFWRIGQEDPSVWDWFKVRGFSNN